MHEMLLSKFVGLPSPVLQLSSVLLNFESEVESEKCVPVTVSFNTKITSINPYALDWT